MADAIVEIDAHVLALQEVEDRHAVERLNAVLATRGKGYPFYWVGAGDDPVTGQDVAIMSQFPSLTEPVRSYPAMQEDFHTNTGYPRVAGLHKFMRVDLEVEGEPVTVFVAASEVEARKSDHVRRRAACASADDPPPGAPGAGEGPVQKSS